MKNSHVQPTPLGEYLSGGELDALIACARREDLGEHETDITTELMGVQRRTGRALMRARTAGTLAGLALLEPIARAYDDAIQVQLMMRDGQTIAPGESAALFVGPLQSILTMERVALNFVTHLSGIATLTALYVQAVRGTKARITDTRKTLPGLRALQKYAVTCGGGLNHRVGLHDAVLVKDNHLAHLPEAQIAEALSAMTRMARSAHPTLDFIEVEVDSLDQLRLVLSAEPDMVLLDNMPPETLREAVSLRDRLASQVLLEASGGISLATVRAVAQTGVDRIAVGALTHSAPALDLGLDVA